MVKVFLLIFISFVYIERHGVSWHEKMYLSLTMESTPVMYCPVKDSPRWLIPKCRNHKIQTSIKHEYKLNVSRLWNWTATTDDGQIRIEIFENAVCIKKNPHTLRNLLPMFENISENISIITFEDKRINYFCSWCRTVWTFIINIWPFIIYRTAMSRQHLPCSTSVNSGNTATYI